jgi:hypothetical protein
LHFTAIPSLKMKTMLTLILLIAGTCCFGLFFKTIDFFENI